jgi:hypothetical protein
MRYVLLPLAGAVLGGLLGYFAFFWIARQGFYAMVLPGGLLGLGAGLARNRSVWIAVVCGLAALALGVYTEWRFAPFADDEGLRFFLANLHHKAPIKLLMIALGSAIGFWVPFRRMETGEDRRESRHMGAGR